MTKEKSKKGAKLVVFGKEQADILRESSGVISQQGLASKIGCSISTFQRVLKRQPEMRDIWEKGSNAIVEEITNIFYELCRSGNVPSVMFFVKTRNTLFQNVETREYIQQLEEAVLKSEGGQEKLEHIIHYFDGRMPSDPMYNYHYADKKGETDGS